MQLAVDCGVTGVLLKRMLINHALALLNGFATFAFGQGSEMRFYGCKVPEYLGH